MEILLLKEFREKNFDHELQQMSSFFNSDLHKFKLETQLKTLTRIVDEKQVGIKDSITIISSLNTSQKMLVSEVLKLVKLILTVTATNAVSERSCYVAQIQVLPAIIYNSRTSKFLFNYCYL